MTHLINNIAKYRYRHKIHSRIFSNDGGRDPWRQKCLRPGGVALGLGLRTPVLAGCVIPSQNPASSTQTRPMGADAAEEARLTPSGCSGLCSFSGFPRVTLKTSMRQAGRPRSGGGRRAFQAWAVNRGWGWEGRYRGGGGCDRPLSKGHHRLSGVSR